MDSRIGVNVEASSCKNVVNILSGLPDIAFNIHGETRGFGNGEPEIEGNCTRHATQPNEQAPAVVDMFERGEVVVNDLSFVCGNDNKRDKSSS